MSFFNSKSIRLKTETQGQNDQFVTLQINQTYDFINILSLKLPITKVYQQFSSEFGVVAGRVNAMGGVGIPNCKVGIFIPKDNDLIEEKLSKLKTDIQRVKIKISELLYPFEDTNTKDSKGRRFNLLPSKGRIRGFNGFPFNVLGIGATPKTPLGTFPEKEHILTDDNWLYIYDNYYYLTTTTNDAGDFMIYAPVGQHTLVMDCDITDIGKFSVTPAIMSKTMDLPSSKFEQNGTKIKPTFDLDTAPNIIHQEVSINIKSLWNQDTDNPEVGITRQDLDIKTDLISSFTIFGSTINLNKNSYYFDWIKFHVYLAFAKLRIFVIDTGFVGAALDPIGIITEAIGFSITKPLKIIDTSEFELIQDGGAWPGFKIGDISNKDCCCTCGIGSFFFFRLDFYFEIYRMQIPEAPDIPIVSDLIEFLNKLLGFFMVGFGMKFKVQFYLIIGALFPVLKFRFGSKRPSVLDGGDYGLPPVGFFYFGQLGYCYPDISIDGIEPDEMIRCGSKADSFRENVNDTEELRDAENIRTEIDVFTIKNNSVIDPNKDIIVLDKDSYYSNIENGTFLLQIPCNSKKVITAEDGTLIYSNDETKGIYSSFDGYITFRPQISLTASPPKGVNLLNLNLKVPQNNDDKVNFYTSYETFNLGEIYSVSQLIPYLSLDIRDDCDLSNAAKIAGGSCNGFAQFTGYPYKILNPNSERMPRNQSNFDFYKGAFVYDVFRSTEKNKKDGWMNFILYFVNIGYAKKYSSKDKLCFSTILITEERLKDNLLPLGGQLFNTKGFTSPEFIETKFIKVDKSDFVYFIQTNSLGFSDNNESGVELHTPTGDYPGITNENYFYKGKGTDSLYNITKNNLI